MVGVFKLGAPQAAVRSTRRVAPQRPLSAQRLLA